MPTVGIQTDSCFDVIDKLNTEFATAQDEILTLNKLLKLDHKKQFNEALDTLTELRDYYLELDCLNESNNNTTESGVIQFNPKVDSPLMYYPDLEIFLTEAVVAYQVSLEVA